MKALILAAVLLTSCAPLPWPDTSPYTTVEELFDQAAPYPVGTSWDITDANSGRVIRVTKVK